MGIVNRILTLAFDLLLAPFRSLHPLWALAAVSLVAGVVMLWIFGKVSNQDSIRTIRDRIRGNLIGIRLFGDDLGLLFRLQARILRQTLTYMRHAVVPMLILLVPVLFILAQLNLRFSVRALEPGEHSVVTVKLRDVSPLEEQVRLELPPGLTLETTGVRIERESEVAWRVRADEAGRHELQVRHGDAVVRKQLVVGAGWGPVSVKRGGPWWERTLFNPGEPPIESSSIVESVRLVYPPMPLSLAGFGVNWLVFFFIVSIAFGFAFKGALGVEI